MHLTLEETVSIIAMIILKTLILLRQTESIQITIEKYIVELVMYFVFCEKYLKVCNCYSYLVSIDLLLCYEYDYMKSFAISVYIIALDTY